MFPHFPVCFHIYALYAVPLSVTHFIGFLYVHIYTHEYIHSYSPSCLHERKHAKHTVLTLLF